MSCIKTIGRNAYKMTIQELCRLYNKEGNSIIFNVIVNKSDRMCESNVDQYLYSRFNEKCLSEKKKILCKK